MDLVMPLIIADAFILVLVVVIKNYANIMSVQTLKAGAVTKIVIQHVAKNSPDMIKMAMDYARPLSILILLVIASICVNWEYGIKIFCLLLNNVP